MGIQRLEWREVSGQIRQDELAEALRLLQVLEAVRALIKVAEHLRDKGQVADAQRTLEQAQMRGVAGSGLAEQVTNLQRELREPRLAPTSTRQPTPAVPGGASKADIWAVVGVLAAVACVLVGAVLASQCGH